MTKKIAVLITHGFDETEYLEPIQAFIAAQHTCIPIDQILGHVIYGQYTKTTVTIEQSIADVNLHDFDALLIPGGLSPLNLLQKSGVLELIHQFHHAKKPIFSISSAALLLLHANVLNQRMVTTHRSLAHELAQAGAYYYDAELVNDHNKLISSRGIQDLPVFIQECLDVLEDPSLYPQLNTKISLETQYYIH